MPPLSEVFPGALQPPCSPCRAKRLPWPTTTEQEHLMAPPPPFGANSAAARDIANVLHPYTDLEAHQQAGPVVIARGKGVRVWDEAGKEYIESIAGLWCASLGFDNERLVQAAVTQMR